MSPAVDKTAADAADEEPRDDEDDSGADAIVHDAEPVPEDGAENGDRLELVRTGLVRVMIGTKRYRLRRPFFGEFKKLRLSLEEVNDEIQDTVDEAQLVARQIAVEGKDHTDDTPDAFAAWRADIRKRSTVAQRAITEIAEVRRIEWWSEMWGLLSLDGTPDDLPAWVTDANIANELMAHWRSSPSGRG